jgi:hypothetical protein
LSCLNTSLMGNLLFKYSLTNTQSSFSSSDLFYPLSHPRGTMIGRKIQIWIEHSTLPDQIDGPSQLSLAGLSRNVQLGICSLKMILELPLVILLINSGFPFSMVPSILLTNKSINNQANRLHRTLLPLLTR